MSTKSRNPSITFGTVAANNKSINKNKTKNKNKNIRDVNHSPGPQEYDTANIRNGVFSLSNKRRPVGVKFTTGPRTHTDITERESSRKPGPSSYIVPSTLSTQFNSRYKSPAKISFGAR